MERFRVPGGALDLVGGGAALLDDLPPGFRFHPTDEELVSFYLLRKALDASFRGRAIAEVDLNRCEPWELPARAADAGTEGEWYFFSLRDRKYPTGLRTNRATRAGYWKATGKDREVRSSAGAAVVGMKKTLVFYRGRAPKGQKTTWVMHEYRLEGTYAYNNFPGSTRDEWVLVRVFQKPVPGEAPSARRNNRLVGLGSAASCCFSDSTSASVGGGGGGASASSAPRQLLLTDASLFAAADGETGGGSYAGGGCYGGANNNADASNNNSIVPCFSTTAAAAPMISSSMDAATLGIGQYSPAPLAIEPPPAAFFAGSLRSLQDNGSSVHQLPLLLSSGTASSSSALGGGGHHFWGPANVKIEGGIGHVAAQPQMAVGPGQLDGAYAWGF